MASEHFGHLALQLREELAHLVLRLGCDCLLVQATSLFDGFSFDALPPLSRKPLKFACFVPFVVMPSLGCHGELAQSSNRTRS